MKKLLRRFLQFLLLGLLIIIGICTLNAIRFSSKQILVDPIESFPIEEQSIQNIAQAIQIPTISSPVRADTSNLLKLDTFIRGMYPGIDTMLERLPVSALSQVFKWPGKNPKLSPILLMGHIDVVPVEQSALDDWLYPPFSGAIEDGYLWGRGTLDDKLAVFSILEAVERLLEEEYQPERTVYLAFGHDEEVGGEQGAIKIAQYFEKQGIQFEYILDEASVVLEEALPGLEAPVALIGVTEKGYATVTLTAQLEQGGHSSMPPNETAIGVLSQAINKLEKHPFPAHFDGATLDMLNRAGPEMSLLYKTIFANLWLTKGLLVSQFSTQPTTNAIIRTTTAPTMLRGGVQPNILPSRASAKINFRIIPGETTAFVVDYVKKTINDSRVIVALDKDQPSSDPPPISSTSSFGFEVLEKTAKEIFPGVVVVPSLVVATTDARHYTAVSDNIFRFLPVQVTREDVKTFHGINEKVSVENVRQSIRYYRQLILNSCK